MKTYYDHVCTNCCQPFQSDNPKQKYCTWECRRDNGVEERLMSKIKVVEGGCWEYLPIRRRPKNYGIFHIRGVRYKAHQAAYLLWNGPLEQGMEVSHECDHSWCVNPAHLRLRTHGSNMEGMAERGRARNGPPKIGTLCNWAKLTDQQVIEIRTSTETNRVLAEKYKVHPRHIWRLKSGECWPHIKPPIDNLDFVCH